MDTEAITIGAYEAKTRFSEILEKAAAGIPCIITRRGKPVAKIVAAESGEISFRELAARVKTIRERVRAEKGTIDVRSYIREGRK
jgi:prevent-host-death family protein